MRIASVASRHYRIPLPVKLSDSTHGDISHVGLITAQIATGKNLHSLHEFQRLIEAGGADYPEPDAATLGGITPWMKVAHLAESFGLPVTSHGVHDIHVHLLAAVPNASYLEFHGFGLERYIETPLTLTDGRATAPDRPGHDIRFDFDALEAHRVA